MELDLRLCCELQSYEIRVIMDSKFSSKKFKMYKLKILDSISIESGMV